MRYILQINPEPWTVGKAFAMRGGGGARIAPDKKLVSYQKAVRETLTSEYDVKPTSSPISLCFFFSRRLEVMTYGKRKSHANKCDATNLQKAIEDALQGILYENDRQVWDVHSTIVDQSPDATPFIIIDMEAEPADEYLEELKEACILSIQVYEKINNQTIDNNNW